MKKLMGGGMTVPFISHDLEQIRSICDRVVWLDHDTVKCLVKRKKSAMRTSADKEK